MAQLLVRNLDEAIVRALRLRAARQGRSVEAEHRALLRAALTPELEPQSFKRFLVEIPEVGGDSVFELARDLPREIDE